MPSTSTLRTYSRELSFYWYNLTIMIELGFITLDFSPFFDAMAVNPLYGMFYLIAHGGWIPMLFVMVDGFFHMYLHHIQDHYASKWQYVLLSIEVPKDNEQSPKAVESMFAQLAGAHSNPNFVEKYRDGKIQESFSFELASHEGVVRFYARTTAQFRDLTEAAIFAQYPDAQITEVEDYTSVVPDDYPNDEWDMFGMELELYANQVFPIRTYPAFEHMLSGEFKDPMAALLEMFAKMGPGEHAWMQLIVVPTGDDWKKGGAALAKKLAGQKEAKKSTMVDKAIGLPTDILGEFIPMFKVDPAAKKDDGKFSIMQLLPNEQRPIEAIGYKIAKIGFLTKFRIIYAGKKGVFHKGRGVSTFVGAIKQFNTQDMNGFKPNKLTITKVDYFRSKPRAAARKRRMIANYKARSAWNGSSPYILNIEELATLWHFPVIGVRAPMVAKTESKRREPPASLPTEASFRLRPVMPPSTAATGAPPMGLPVEEEPFMQPTSEAMGARSDSDHGAPPSNLPVG